jgi:hypothetical protein
MKPRRQKSAPAPPPLRRVNLYARFTPEGPEAGDREAFLQFALAAEQRTLVIAGQQAAEAMARLAKLRAAYQAAAPVLRRLFRAEITVEAAAGQLKRLLPDPALAREVWATWKQAASATAPAPGQELRSRLPTPGEDEARSQPCGKQSLLTSPPTSKQSPSPTFLQALPLAEATAQAERSRQQLRAMESMARGLSALALAADTGDAGATKALIELVTEAVGLVETLVVRHPDVVRSLARDRTRWPVLASEETGWEREAARRVAALELGAGLQWLKVRFRQARGTDANLPARVWAKAAVRTLEAARQQHLLFGALRDRFGSLKALATFCAEAGWAVGKSPPWVALAAGLAPFSTVSLPEWKPVIRALIREQMPEFHTRPEWSNQRNTASHNGRNTVGEIQNAILDDISSALSRLAPGPPC